MIVLYNRIFYTIPNKKLLAIWINNYCLLINYIDLELTIVVFDAVAIFTISVATIVGFYTRQLFALSCWVWFKKQCKI